MARDEYFNLRGSNVGDNFVARVRQYYSKGGNNDDAAGMDVVECGRPGADCEAYNTYSWGWTTTGGRDKPATVVDNGDGSYAISYQATRSTTNYVWASFAQAGGLQATYYVGGDHRDRWRFGWRGVWRCGGHARRAGRPDRGL